MDIKLYCNSCENSNTGRVSRAVDPPVVPVQLKRRGGLLRSTATKAVWMALHPVCELCVVWRCVCVQAPRPPHLHTYSPPPREAVRRVIVKTFQHIRVQMFGSGLMERFRSYVTVGRKTGSSISKNSLDIVVNPRGAQTFQHFVPQVGISPFSWL